jgi:transcriptional regulator with XRE-family HTH domain
MPEPSEFGKRLRELRKRRDWTQEDLAEVSGVSAQMVSHFETGARQKASADNLVNLAKALRCSVDYLLGATEEPELTDPRARSVFRRLSGAPSETIDQAVKVVDALLGEEGQKKRERKRK